MGNVFALYKSFAESNTKLISILMHFYRMFRQKKIVKYKKRIKFIVEHKSAVVDTGYIGLRLAIFLCNITLLLRLSSCRKKSV